MGSYATVYYVEEGIVDAVHRNATKGHKDFTFTKDEDGTYHVMKKGMNNKKTIENANSALNLHLRLRLRFTFCFTHDEIGMFMEI